MTRGRHRNMSTAMCSRKKKKETNSIHVEKHVLVSLTANFLTRLAHYTAPTVVYVPNATTANRPFWIYYHRGLHTNQASNTKKEQKAPQQHTLDLRQQLSQPFMQKKALPPTIS